MGMLKIPRKNTISWNSCGWLAAEDFDNVAIWDMRGVNIVWKAEIPLAPVRSIALNANGILAIANEYGLIAAWNTTLSPTAVYVSPVTGRGTVAVSEQNKIAACKRNLLIVICGITGDVICSAAPGNNEEIYTAAWSSTGWLATSQGSSGLFVWDIPNVAAPIWIGSHGDRWGGDVLAWSHSGYLAAAHDKHVVNWNPLHSSVPVWDTETEGVVRDLSWSLDGRWLAISSEYGVGILHGLTGRLVATVKTNLSADALLWTSKYGELWVANAGMSDRVPIKTKYKVEGLSSAATT